MTGDGGNWGDNNTKKKKKSQSDDNTFKIAVKHMGTMPEIIDTIAILAKHKVWTKARLQEEVSATLHTEWTKRE